MTNDEYWFWLCNIEGIWQQDIKRILAAFKTPEEVYKAPDELVAASGTLSPAQTQAMALSKKNPSALIKKQEYLKKNKIRFIHADNPDFPERLKYIPDAPYSFYLKGCLPDPQAPAAGIVGARACSGYGKEMTLRFSSALAAKGVQIVSGMAHGIDACSAQGALKAGGAPFAVLGSGVDVIYPKANTELYYNIILSGGVISEYPPGTQPLSWQFPHRNRLISGLSDIVLVMEARKRSGTLITANCALEQGKEVFALPGRTDDPLSFGCNSLIADGAGVLLTPEGLLEHIFGVPFKEKAAAKDAFKNLKFPDPVYKKVFIKTCRHAKSVQNIADESGCTATEAAAALTWLEINGFVEEISADYYIRLL